MRPLRPSSFFGPSAFQRSHSGSGIASSIRSEHRYPETVLPRFLPLDHSCITGNRTQERRCPSVCFRQPEGIERTDRSRMAPPGKLNWTNSGASPLLPSRITSTTKCPVRSGHRSLTLQYPPAKDGSAVPKSKALSSSPSRGKPAMCDPNSESSSLPA